MVVNQRSRKDFAHSFKILKHMSVHRFVKEWQLRRDLRQHLFDISRLVLRLTKDPDITNEKHAQQSEIEDWWEAHTSCAHASTCTYVHTQSKHTSTYERTLPAPQVQQE